MAEPLLIPADAAQRLLAAANGDAALLYLYLLRRGGVFEADGVRKALGWTAEQVRGAYQALANLGLVDKDCLLYTSDAADD